MLTGIGFKAIATGLDHSLGLKNDGTLWAWGENDNGQLGDGTTMDRSLPVQVGEGFTAVTAGAYHSLGLKKRRHPLCLGKEHPGADRRRDHCGPNRAGPGGRWFYGHCGRHGSFPGAERRWHALGMGRKPERPAWRRDQHETYFTGANRNGVRGHSGRQWIFPGPEMRRHALGLGV